MSSLMKNWPCHRAILLPQQISTNFDGENEDGR